MTEHAMNLDTYNDGFEDEDETDAVVLIYGPVSCPRPCAECEGEPHHWLPEFIGEDDGYTRMEFLRARPHLVMDEATWGGFQACKHCLAVGAEQWTLEDPETEPPYETPFQDELPVSERLLREAATDAYNVLDGAACPIDDAEEWRRQVRKRLATALGLGR